MKNTKELGFATRAIHAGQEPDPTTGAIMTPVYLTSTYVQASPGVHKGYEYSRTHNPTRAAYEACLASLEGGTKGFAFASGLSATMIVLHMFKAGDHVVAGDDMYGGTFRLFDKVLRHDGFEFTYADLTDPANLERALKPNTKLLWLETPTNPMLKLVDIEALCKIAHARGVMVAVDNTFMSPYFQRPLALGADLVQAEKVRACERANNHGPRLLIVCSLFSLPLSSIFPYLLIYHKQLYHSFLYTIFLLFAY